MQKLNHKQQYAFSCMKQGMNVFLTGAGGTGKSTVLRHFITWAKEKKYPLMSDAVAVTSTTGISAIIIGGTTLHSFAGIGLGKKSVDELITQINKKYFIKRRWLRTKILIIDEVSMLKPELLEKLEEIARRVRRNSHIFGGIQVILSADFCQLPPVHLTKFCFESELWDQLIDESIYLKEIIRQDNKEFQDCLNEIRLGDCSPKTQALLESRIGVKLENNMNIVPTMLYPINLKVDNINQKFIQELIDKGNEHHTYDLQIQASQPVSKAFEQVMDKMVRDCPADPTLTLVEGAQVMVIVNMSNQKLVNGSRGIITGFVGGIPKVGFLDGREIIMYQHKWEVELTEKITISLIQIPLKVCVALTIHKNQGMGCDYVETSIDSSIFEYGQAYVALSRCRSLEGLTLKEFNPEVIKCHPKVKEFYQKLDKEGTKTIEDYWFSK